MFNELRDLDEDIKAGVTHTASLLGARITYWLMMGICSAGVGSALVSIFVVRLVPGWVLLLLIFLAVILIRPALFRIHRGQTTIELQQSFQKPLEIAAATALLIQFIGTWALKYFDRF